MSIGERLKMARRTTGLSQQALADEVGVSKMAISKYERDRIAPGSAMLLKLARALDVKTEYFFRPITVTLASPAFRCRASLRQKQKDAILSQTQEWLERYLEVESFFSGSPRFALPDDLDRHVASLDEVERVALDLRRAWDLGVDPIESLMEILEDQGIKIGLVDGYDNFDALTLRANDEVPVIAVKQGVPGDRQRYDLAHELGHLVLEPSEDVDAEKAAHRFAGAFLVPEPVAQFELGHQRHTLSVHELHSLKHKYGLSMQAWIYRAKDVGILPKPAFDRLFRHFTQQGWRRQEPGNPIPSEEPGRMERLVIRAWAEDMITKSRAAELLGMPLVQFWKEKAKQYDELPTDMCD